MEFLPYKTTVFFFNKGELVNVTHMNSTKIFNTVDKAAILDIVFRLTFTTSYRTKKIQKELGKEKEDMVKIFFFSVFIVPRLYQWSLTGICSGTSAVHHFFKWSGNDDNLSNLTKSFRPVKMKSNSEEFQRDFMTLNDQIIIQWCGNKVWSTRM